MRKQIGLLTNIDYLLNRLSSRIKLYPIAVASAIIIAIAVLDVSLVHSQSSVTGTVYDAETGGTPPAVNIAIQGTTSGTVTNPSGEYALEVPDQNTVLIFSYVGYTSQQIEVGDQEVIDVRLEMGLDVLDELVVVGYGTQRAATLTGSIVNIDSRDISRSPASTVASSLQGMLPGLASLQRTGEPGGDGSTLLIRGQSTTGNNAPLVLVDGVPEPDWQRINSNDIESVSVLKDAAAAIYGVQAANGVILITTKRGTLGKPVFSATYNQGFVQPTRIPKMASSATLAEFSNEYLVRDGGDPLYTEEEIQKFRDGSDPLLYPNTNWAEEGFKNVALQNTANMSVRGGGEDIQYSLSGSFYNQDDIIKDGTHRFQNYTVRSNIDAQISQSFGLSLDLNVGMGDRTTPRYRQIGALFVNPPTIPVYWPGGYPSNPPSDQGQHPMINNTGGSGYDDRVNRRFSGKFAFDLVLPWTEGLTIDGYFHHSNDQNRRKIWSTPWTYYSWDRENQVAVPQQGGFASLANLEESFNNNFSNLINLRLQYQRDFNDHYLNTFIAAEQLSGHYESFSSFRRDFMATAIDELFAGSNANQNTNGYSSESARQNIFGRVSYNFQEKYLLDFNFRYDGTFRFPEENRWGFFPGVSAAWRLSQENFLSNSEVINELKLRASYGEMGNDAGINPFQYLQSYNLNTSGTYFGGTPDPVIWGGVAPNPNITWEVATITNMGLDVELLDSMFGMTIEVFRQKRSNILTTRALEVPGYTGLILPSENIGVVTNQGIDLSVTHINHLSLGRGLRYSISANMGFARNKVLDVSEAADVPEHQKMEGRPLGAGLYYRAIGIFRTQEEIDNNPHIAGTIPGDLQYYDYDGDGQITANDRIRMDKSIYPDMTFGLNLSVDYANFSLFSHFSGVTGADWWIYDIARTGRNAPAELLENRYRPGSMDSKYPWIPTWHPDMEVSGMTSDFWVQDASFLRLKTLEFSYNLPDNLTTGLGLSSMRLYVSGSNIFTISHIKDYDPEGANPGVNYGAAHFYPQTRVFNLGAQLTF